MKLYKQAEGIKGMLSLDDEVLGKVTINPTPLSSKVKGILAESFYYINLLCTSIMDRQFFRQIISVTRRNTSVYGFITEII